MICPLDKTELKMSDRQGIEIDYCPTCRGIWLDRGELDKIIDRLKDTNSSRYQEEKYNQRNDRRYDHDDDDDGEDGFNFGGNRNDRKGGFLNNLFDIGE